MSEIRLQKFLSERGIASRREAERLIAAGFVRVNGVIVKELGTKIDPEVDDVSYRGKAVSKAPPPLYYLINKPKNIIVTRKDPEGRKTVYELIPNLHPSVNSVGRLDFDSEGLLLLTNDGDLAYRLTHPSFEVKKVYEVQVNQKPSPEKLRSLERGVLLEGEKTAPARISLLPSQSKKEIWYSIEIHEGKKRQVRRMFEWADVKVLRLIRVKLADLELGNLPSGKSRQLKNEEIESLKKL